MNSLATGATSSVGFGATAATVDYNSICFMLCVTVLILAWILTQNRTLRQPQPETEAGNRVLCFLSLTTCSQTVVNADAVNSIMANIVDSDVVIAGAFPQEDSDGEVFEFASYDGRPIPYREVLQANFQKVNISEQSTLDGLRSVLGHRYRTPHGPKIRKAKLHEVRSFKSNLTRERTYWGQIGAPKDKAPVFFPLDGMGQMILIMCIQYPGCRAHNFAPTKMCQV